MRTEGGRGEGGGGGGRFFAPACAVRYNGGEIGREGGRAGWGGGLRPSVRGARRRRRPPREHGAATVITDTVSLASGASWLPQAPRAQ